MRLLCYGRIVSLSKQAGCRPLSMGAVLITLGGGKAPCHNCEAGAAYTVGCDAHLSLPGHPLNLAVACGYSEISCFLSASPPVRSGDCEGRVASREP